MRQKQQASGDLIPLPVAKRKPRPAARADSPAKLARARAKMDHARKSLAAMRAARRADPPTGARARNYGRGVSSVEMLLSARELGEYYELLRQPATTLAVAHQWLRQRGHKIGFCAVHRHRQKFRQRLSDQRQAAEMSHMINLVALERGPGVVTDASAAYVEQQMMLSLINCIRASKEGESFDPQLWLQTNKAVGEAIKNRGTLEKLRKFIKAFEPGKPFDGFKVALVMREMLGIPPPPPPKQFVGGKFNPDADAQAAEVEAYRQRYLERQQNQAAAAPRDDAGSN
jgi:hypothetical protein